MGASPAITLFGAQPDSIVDGPGLRYAVFVQGCSHGCPGCHNPGSQPRDGGTMTTIDAVYDDISSNGLIHDVTFTGGEPFEQAAACAALARRLKDEGYGVWAYTGYLYEDLERAARGDAGCGDGAQESAACGTAYDGDVHEAAQDDAAHGGAHEAAACGTARDDAAYEAARENVSRETFPLDAQGVRDFLDCVDVLVDGPFVQSLKSLNLTWRGSANQRLIDLAATRAAGHIVEWSSDEMTFEKPASW